MGIGSPELQTIRAACVLPFAVAACLIGAPAAFADAVVATPPQAAVVAAAAEPADGIAETVTRQVADTTQAVEQRVAVSQPATATHRRSLKTAKNAVVPPRIAPPRSPARANAATTSLRSSEPRFQAAVAHKPARASSTPPVTPRTIFDAAPVSDGGAAVGGTPGVELLLLGLLAFAVLSAPPDAFRRRIAPRARLLRPSSLLLQLDRPD